MEKRILEIFRTQPIAQNLHQLGLSPVAYHRKLLVPLKELLHYADEFNSGD